MPPTAQAFDWASYQEQQLNRLADTVRSSLDMERIYQLIEQEGEEG
jgi:cobyric acid synthase